MMINKKHKIASVILVLSMLLCYFPPVRAENDIITISDRKDFIAFAKSCTLDTWSVGKTVELTCNINMTGVEFSLIPTFGGTFNGNGYTISGINFTKNGSNMGLFRYIQNTGKVSNLNVKGRFEPEGSKSHIGGIAGENSGVIESCSFSGRVHGENVIGGICGKNMESGQIISCRAEGSVAGENSTGGISGKNEGLILDCINDAEINTVYEEKKRDLSDINADAGAIVETYKTEKDENEEESVLGHTDTGGIAGYSCGIIQGCTNNADIGYKHIGYNVGGITGRQSGYLLGCTNYGFVQGRKDVGGIVGQMEPYIILNASETSLRDIRRELNNMHSMVERLIADTDTLGINAENHLSKISQYSKTARDSTEQLLNSSRELIDDNFDEANAQIAIISNTIDKLVPVFGSLSDGASDAGDAIGKAIDALNDLEIYAPELGKNFDEIGEALDSMADAEQDISKASVRAQRALINLENGIRTKNDSDVEKALSNLSSAVKDIASEKIIIKSSIEKIEDIIKTRPESAEALGANTKEILENLKVISEHTEKTSDSFKTVSKSLDTIILNTKLDFSSFQAAAQNMESALSYLSDGMDDITVSIKKLRSALSDTTDKIHDYTDDINAQLTSAKKDLSDSLLSLSYATDDITNAMNDTKNIISDLSNEKTMTFIKPGDDFRQAGDNLFGSLADISGEIGELRNSVSAERNNITGDLKTISNQFNLVMNMMLGEIEEIQNKNEISDIFLDVSDEDIENTKQGKVAECINSGRVEADRNTGGIAGALAIEYTKDPEDEIEKPDTLNFTYRTKAILQSCINEGNVIGKKDCTGGIVGLSELGTVYECENYGDAESTNGNYIGGIAGKSESAIRKCYSKCKVKGKSYIGGIAGKAYNLTSCYTIVNIDGDECAGAICGICDSRDKIYKNFFVDNGLGGIDAVSYKDISEPMSFDVLKEMEFIPRRFISFIVSFIADNKVIEKQEIKYGDDTARIKYPNIPEKSGHFGHWQKPEAKTVTEDIDVVCEYQPYITIIASEEKNENGKLALALAEGEFTDESKLHIKESTCPPYKKAFGNVKVYDIELTDASLGEKSIVTLRLLNENRDRVTVWQYDGSEWKQLESKARGKYAILEATGASSTLCVQYTNVGFGIMWTIIIIAAAAMLVIALIGVKRKNKKR